jgi:membrane protein DedA with SNARE-associated domain/rhodanese-related sulfurtransferase
MTQLIDLLREYGLGLVFLNVLALQAGLPVPAYPTLIVAGAVMMQDASSVLRVLGTGVAAALIADTLWYLAGRRFGTRVLRILCRISLSPDSCVRQTESIFDRFGPVSMLFAKFVPGFASVATAMAGVIRMPFWKFAIFDGLGAALWVGVGLGLGRLFRGAIGEVLDTLQALGKYGALLVLAALAVYIATRWWQRRMFIRQLRMDRVTVHELYEMIDRQQVHAVLDVRSPLTQKASGWIPGAHAIDMERIAESIVGVPNEGEIVVYCACPNEASAVKVAESLRRLGFRRVRPLLGGIDAWIEAGFDIERPDQ